MEHNTNDQLGSDWHTLILDEYQALSMGQQNVETVTALHRCIGNLEDANRYKVRATRTQDESVDFTVRYAIYGYRVDDVNVNNNQDITVLHRSVGVDVTFGDIPRCPGDMLEETISIPVTSAGPPGLIITAS